MSDRRDDRELSLSDDDAAFVRWLAESYRAPQSTPGSRAAFRATLAARVRRRSGPVWPLVGAGLAAAVVASTLVLWQTRFVPGLEGNIAVARVSDPSPEDVLLVLAMPSSSADESLPEDYEAIAGLFLGEV